MLKHVYILSKIGSFIITWLKKNYPKQNVPKFEEEKDGRRESFLHLFLYILRYLGFAKNDNLLTTEISMKKI